MKQTFLLAWLLSFSFLNSLKAQTYTQGDINVNQIISATHDSSQCMSFAIQQLSFIISNSFLNDSVIIKDQLSGMVIATQVNTTGANPWNFMMNPNTLMPVVPDNMVVAGMAVFTGNTMKIICGSDTLLNVVPFYQLPVPNPCLYADVSGRVYIDQNQDCLFNSGDIPLQSIPAEADAVYTASSNTQFGYSDVNGSYTIQLQQSWLSNYTVSIPSNYAFIFPSTACSPLSYSYTTLPQTHVDFSLQCSSQVDVQAGVAGPAFVRPLDPFVLSPYVSNTGCDTASGILTLIKDTHTTYNASLSTNPATYVNGDTLKWIFTNLTNLSTGAYWNSFFAGVYLTPTASVNSGDTLCFTVLSTIPTADVNAANNQSSLCIPVVNSYDPNLKEVSPKGSGTNGLIPINTPELDYTIHFQNTGTAAAYNIDVLDTLDAHVDPATLRIISTSHTMNAKWVSPNVVRFSFPNIMLPDSTSNEPKSHGQFKYSIHLKSGLSVGNQIKNKAGIYFDSNPAVYTNTTLNTLGLASSVLDPSLSKGTEVYPNPADDILWVELSVDDLHAGATAYLYGIDEQLIRNVALHENKQAISVADLSPGLYLIRIQSGTRVYTQKWIKH